jgi:hypothetical protein
VIDAAAPDARSNVLAGLVRMLGMLAALEAVVAPACAYAVVQGASPWVMVVPGLIVGALLPIVPTILWTAVTLVRSSDSRAVPAVPVARAARRSARSKHERAIVEDGPDGPDPNRPRWKEQAS